MGEVVQKKSKRCSDEEAMSARREEILEMATQLFADQGFSDAVTQVLADRPRTVRREVARELR